MKEVVKEFEDSATHSEVLDSVYSNLNEPSAHSCCVHNYCSSTCKCNYEVNTDHISDTSFNNCRKL